MKKCLVLLMVLCGMFVFSGVASATIFTLNGGIDVGELDTFLFKTDLPNSGDETEINWVKSVLQTQDISLDAKYGAESPNWKWEPTTQTDTYALHFLTDEPEYFLLKTGNLQTSSYNTFLFQNNPNLDWAVINLSSSIPNIIIKNLGKLSHIDEFNDPKAVPEPATLILFGSGLIGLAAFKRKLK
jgi:hypothetical protein